LYPLFATGVIDTGGKFAAGVVDTGGNLPPASLIPVANSPPVSLTPVANLPPVSTTLAKLVEKFAAGVADTGGKVLPLDTFLKNQDHTGAYDRTRCSNMILSSIYRRMFAQYIQL
jgi:hypothetical protein